MHMRPHIERGMSGWHIYAPVSDKRVWLPCQLLKALGHAGVVVVLWEKEVGGEQRQHMGAQLSLRRPWCAGAAGACVCVAVAPVLWWVGSAQGVRGMERLVST